MGMTRMQAAVRGTTQIAVAVLGCTAVLIFAFLPLTMLPEGAGKFTRGLPIAVIATVLASLLVALTIIPFLASRILPREESEHGNRVLQATQGGIQRFYAPVLHWALERPRTALAGAMALCVAALGLIPVLGSSLFPTADTPYFLVEVRTGEGTDTGGTDAAVRHVERVLASEPAVKHVLANVGRGNPQVFYNVRENDQRSSYGAVLAVLEDWHPRETPELIERVRGRFADYPARITLNPFQNGAPITAPIEWLVRGPDLAEVKRLSLLAEAAMRSVPGTRDVRNPLAVDRIDLDLGLDPAKAAVVGVAPAAARRVARLALVGESAGRFRDEEGDSYDVMVRLPSPPGTPESGARQRVEALERMYVPSANGSAVPLLQVASPRLTGGPPFILRDRQERSVNISSNVAAGYLTSKVNAEVAEKLRAIPLPPGYALRQGGEADARARSFGGLGGVIVLAVFGITAVLVLEFGRFREVAVVAGVIPLGMFGGLIALWANGLSISYTAIIGFVALIGIEIKNSILLVDFTNQLRAEGVELRAAIERAGEVRFLPVLLTSVTAIGGLLPLALSGSGLYSPLAWVIIGGLVSSTLLSRVVTPVMYLLLVRSAPAVEA
jgi:multidrug efflux pump subunit AcrB